MPRIFCENFRVIYFETFVVLASESPKMELVRLVIIVIQTLMD